MTEGAGTPAWSSQQGFDARFDWGPAGVERLRPYVSALVVVDVLRFTSAVETGCTAGVVVYPYRWRDDSAAGFAASLEAILAGRSDEGGPSLSPQSLLKLAPGSKVVLPSPNGATCSLLAAEAGRRVAAGCLRNAAAVAGWLDGQSRPVGVIACGETWPDGSLRPSIEDLIGAGAVLSRLHASLSPEAGAAVAAFEAASAKIESTIWDCASGRQLAEMGLADDVRWCSALDVSSTVPVLEEGAFRAAKR